MDFDDTPDEAKFRATARDWLAANAPRFSPDQDAADGEGFSHMALSRAWQAAKADGGFAEITWPRAYGGRDGSAMDRVIFDEEQRKWPLPPTPFAISLGMCIPTLMAWGRAEEVARLVPPAVRGDTLWCQMFSEPSAGSDLANVRTRAVRDGDDWIINGQKVWTTGAHMADWATILVRSDPAAEKYAGLSYFYFDMRSPGVEVRQIRQASGIAGFNEVFLTDLRVPDSQRLGGVGDGWKVAISTLMHERMSVNEAAFGKVGINDVIRLATEFGDGNTRAIDDPALQVRLAQIYTRIAGVRYTRYRQLTKLSQGELPGAEAALGKLVLASSMVEAAKLAIDLYGPAGIIADPAYDPRLTDMQGAWLGHAGTRIAGGTDEILKNTIAERVLGLPGERRVDRGKPFNELSG